MSRISPPLQDRLGIAGGFRLLQYFMPGLKGRSCFLCTRQRCVNEALFTQGPFDKIQGQLGKISGLFKDLSNFSIFKDFLTLFQGLFKARANHVEEY